MFFEAILSCGGAIFIPPLKLCPTHGLNFKKRLSHAFREIFFNFFSFWTAIVMENVEKKVILKTNSIYVDCFSTFERKRSVKLCRKTKEILNPFETTYHGKSFEKQKNNWNVYFRTKISKCWLKTSRDLKQQCSVNISFFQINFCAIIFRLRVLIFTLFYNKRNKDWMRTLVVQSFNGPKVSQGIK